MRSILLAYFLSYFALVSLIPGFDATQLAKMPHLISHFEEKHDEPNVDFFDFLVSHYFNQPANDHENNEHENLPLFHLSFTTYIYLPTAKKPQLECASETPVSIQLARYFSPFLPSDFTKRIFQPPQV